jgi:hypothetical protein
VASIYISLNHPQTTPYGQVSSLAWTFRPSAGPPTPLPHLFAHLLDLFGDLLTGVLDLLLSREEQEDVPGGLARVDLDDSPDGRLEVVPFGILRGVWGGVGRCGALGTTSS